jgi:uncharacterized protein (DUF697 family)
MIKAMAVKATGVPIVPIPFTKALITNVTIAPIKLHHGLYGWFVGLATQPQLNKTQEKYLFLN